MLNKTDIHLAPVPKRILIRDGALGLAGNRYIRLDAADPQSVVAAAKQTGLDWELTASPMVPKDQFGMAIDLTEPAGIPPEGYHLDITEDGIYMKASSPAGAFYGASTLAQIRRQTGDLLPCLSIEDWPDFPHRGLMLDISRDKVPTMETLYHLVDMLAGWKINQLHLYTEHTFAYLAHPVVWEGADPMTGEEVLALDAHCRSKFIELVPCQNSFGHMERWLKHDEYRPMAELPYGGETAWGYRDYPLGLSAVDDRCIPFIDSLYKELLPHFSSDCINVVCDETADLGYGRSKPLCDEVGTGRVYLDFLMEIYQLTKKYDRRMFYAYDVILHYPELIDELPRDAITLVWGFESGYPFDEHIVKFRQSGIPSYIVCGTSAWCSLSGRTENAIDNISSAAKTGFANGAEGLLNTTWGDHGYWDPLSVAYLGLLAGAMAAWNSESDVRTSLPRNLSIHAFGDLTGKTGQAFYDLGNLYRLFSAESFNSAIYWHMLFSSTDPAELDKVRPAEFMEMERKLDQIVATLDGEKMSCLDADKVRAELRFVAEVLKFAASVGEMRTGGADIKDLETHVEHIKNQHRRTYLLRNRPGPLENSVGFLKLDWLRSKVRGRL